MKKILFPMIALLAGVTLTSCEDKLDIEQKGSMTTENFYKTDADCQKALASAYESFQLYTVGRGNGEGPGIYTPARVLANHPGDDILYASGNYGDHEWGGSVNEFRFTFRSRLLLRHRCSVHTISSCWQPIGVSPLS